MKHPQYGPTNPEATYVEHTYEEHLAGLGECLFPGHGDEAVEPWVVLLDAPEIGPGQLVARKLARAQRCGEFGKGGGSNLHGGGGCRRQGYSMTLGTR